MESGIGRLDALPDGRLSSVQVGERTLLVARLGDEVRVMAPECPHYHAPLADGILHDDRVSCPWHQSVFRAHDGDLLEPPSFFALPTYAVRVADGEVIVDVIDDGPAQRLPAMTPYDPEAEKRTVAIVGAGAAAAAAGDELRQRGFAGGILLIGPEDHLPYDRPNCSKDLLAGTMSASWMPLHAAKFYEKWGVERLLDTVVSLDARSRRMRLASGRVVTADAVLIASGGVPRRLAVPGGELGNVFTLRSWDDCEAIAAACDGARHAVIVGASFIAMEAAASLRHRGLRVAVAAPDRVPLQRVFGAATGASLRALHERHGVVFHLGHGVAALHGNGRVSGAELEDGTLLPADLVVVGVGVTPATGFVDGVEKAADGSLPVDGQLRVAGAAGVWAAGDVARFPAAHLGGEPVRIEHWRLALQHGRAAARSILGEEEPFADVPFFWTQQYDLRLNFAGYGRPWDEIVLDGRPPGDFIAYYCSAGRPHAAAGTRDRQLCAFSELMRLAWLPDAERLRADPGLDLLQLLD
jgi:NADPH-dependent 2,4-dienoyl-CoA reductase/sulfur reductase-like enzyme/nitrite reductase/ring-hydroxylating ferredoxin subunit